uniref:Uncharacterized protein n=1 Tax=Anopheles atroparvus TaxID=41427 RepID=A0A182JJG9_ANOAO
MAPISVTLLVSGFLCVVQAADVKNNVPRLTSDSLKGNGESSFPPSSNWALPQSLDAVSSFINKTSSSILKPSNGVQVGVDNSGLTIASNDPVVFQVPAAYKPEKPNLIQQLLSNTSGLNNSFAMIANLAQGKPEEKPPTTANDPLPNPVQGLIDSSQSAVTNASSAVQGVAGQWSTNVQNGFGNFLGASSNRPSNDEAASGSTNPSLNPIQSLVESSQASWNNATGAAQVIAGQLGSNVQNGITNVFGINLNRPSNDEPAQPVAETTSSSDSSTPEPEQQTATSATQSSTASEIAASSTTSASLVEATTSTTSASTTGAAFSNVLGILGNNSQTSLLNTSALVQTLTSNVQNGPLGFLFANLNRPGAATPGANGNAAQKPQDAPADTPLADTPPPPTPPTCNACASVQCSYSPWRNLRIIGGSNVPSPMTYPWITLITYLQSPNGQGSLINDRAVLTTATIVSSMPIIAEIRAIVGLYTLSSALSATQQMISSTYKHPSFVSTNPFANNIGLLILQTPLSSFVPVCLPTPSAVFFGLARATVIGWGSTTTSTGSLSDNLQEAEFQMYATLACQYSNPQITNNNLCGGLIQPSPIIQATCTGDGGDPLVVKPSGTSTWQLIGVALDIPGYGCGKYRQPSVFTNVASYANWIAAYGPGCNCPQSGY